MQFGKLFDPYFLTYWLTTSTSPWLAKLFGGRTELANFGDPIHDSIFAEAEGWRQAWLASQAGPIDDHLRLASYAMAAGRCRDELLRRQLGRRHIWFERIFFSGAFLVTALQIALNACYDSIRARRLAHPSGGVVCFPANRTVRTTVAEVLPDTAIHHLATYGYYLSWDAARFFLITIWRARPMLRNPRLLSNFLRLLSQYCHVVEHYRPRIVVGFFDGTSSISLLTAYLRGRGIAHYNIMHGEIFYSTDHSTYAEADRFYVWGEYYKNILLRQHCPDNQYYLHASPLLADLFIRQRHRQQPREKRLLLLHEPYIELNDHVYASMLQLLESLDAGWTVSVRPHPTYRGNLAEFIAQIRSRLSKAAQNLIFVPENPHAIIPSETLIRHRVVAACVSTMLLEGWLAGCKIVYFSGLLRDELFLERYQSSPNVLIATPKLPIAEISRFVDTPVVLDEQETSRIAHVVQVNPGPP